MRRFLSSTAPVSRLETILIIVISYALGMILGICSANAAEPEVVIPEWQKADKVEVVVPVWQLEDDQFVWIKIIAVNEKGNFIESFVAPDCNKAERVERRGEEIAPGVYAEGLAGEGVSKPPNIRMRDDRKPDQRRYCRNTLAVTINGEVVAWPAERVYAQETRFGIPKRDGEVRIRMPSHVLSHEYGTSGRTGTDTPMKANTNTIVIPIDRFGDEIATVKVVYTPSANLADWADTPLPNDP